MTLKYQGPLKVLGFLDGPLFLCHCDQMPIRNNPSGGGESVVVHSLQGVVASDSWEGMVSPAMPFSGSDGRGCRGQQTGSKAGL